MYGEVEVVSMSPSISATNDPTEGLCLGGIVGIGVAGGLSVHWLTAANANARNTASFDSPAVFTVTFRLGNPNPNIQRGSEWNGGEHQPFIYANGGSSFPPFDARAIAMIRVKPSDRLSGKVYDIQTNFPNSAEIKAVPMPNTKVRLYSLPDKKLIVENVSSTDGSYVIKPEKFNPDLTYLLVTNATSDGRKIRQEIDVNTLTELDIYLPKSIVHNYISLIEGLDFIRLPLMTDEDLALGIGTGGPLKDTSLFGSLADLERYDIEVNTSEGSTLKEDLVTYLDEILKDPPVCRDLRGSAVSGDPWASLLRLSLFMAYVKDRVPDAYVSIDNAVKGLTVAIMTNLMMSGIQSKGKGWQSYVDKYTPKRIQGAQNWLLDKGNKNMLKIANTRAHALIQTRIPEGTQYLRARINPLEGNCTVTISFDEKAVARINPTPGWRSYTVSADKSMSIITCSASSSNLTLGETVNIRGALTREAQGATISIEMTGPSGKTNSATTTTSGGGEYSYSLKPDEEGYWLIQSSWRGDENYSNSTSYELMLRVNEVKPTGITTGVPSYPLVSIIVGLTIVMGILIKTRTHIILSSAQKQIQME